PSASVKALGRYLMLAKQAFEKGVEPEVISKAFTQFARFGHYASFAMTQGKKTDREILEDWNGRIPEKKRLVVSIPAGGRDLSESAKEGLKSANREAKKKTTDLREGLRKLENALIHPSLRDLTVSSAEGMAQIERLGREITSTESESALLEMMKEYPSICQLYKHHLFQEILQRQGRAVVFTSLDCSRDLTKKMLETLFRHQKKRVKLLTLHGSMSKEERQSALSSFRSAMGKDDARVLIISLQTGAVGLNIPEAEVSFFLTKGGYNPAYVEQAEDRIVRANCKSAGEVRHVVHFDWGTLLDEHVEVIRRKKQLWSELLKSCRELTAENMPMLFDLFVQILAYDRAHEILRASHSPKEMQALLWQKLPNKLLGELMRRPITHLMKKRLDENRGVISLRTLLSNLFVGKDNKALEEILALPQIAKLVDRRVDLNEESLAKADRVEVLLGGMGIDVAQFLAEAKPPFIKHCLQVIPSFIPARKDPEVPAPKKPRRAAGKEVTQAALEAVQGGAKRPFGQFERIAMPVEGERGLKLAAWIGERASNDAALRAELVHTFKDRSLFEEVRGGRIDMLGALQELFTRGLQEEEVRTDSNVRVWTFADGAYHNISGIASSSDQTIHLFGKSLAKGRNAYELLLDRS
ncbi:MAG: hypothetical protein KDK48_02870, partial [Chlamydiia bacterium]|nr:hypothetical protein [Chlamydiia bacterium]